MTQEFDLCPYPLKLWIVARSTADDINGRFTCYNDRNAKVVEDAEDDDRKSYLAFVSNVVDSETYDIGLLVVLNDEEDIDAGTIAHGSFHVADKVRQHVGLEFSLDGDNEHIAYLIGYVARCIEKFKRSSI